MFIFFDGREKRTTYVQWKSGKLIRNECIINNDKMGETEFSIKSAGYITSSENKFNQICWALTK